MGTWTRLALVAGGTAVAVALTTLLAVPSDATGEPEVRPSVVRVSAVQAAPDHRTARLHGLTRARERATVGFTAPGRLVERPVDVGDHVREGDILARLDAVPLRHRVADARATLADLEARLTQVAADRARMQQLAAGDAVAPAERERLESQERSLEASVERARVGVEEALRQQREGVLRAAHDAEVIAIHAEPGETVGAGAPVVSLAGEGLEIVVEAPEPVWARLDTDATASVSLPGVGCLARPARVTRVGRGTQGPLGLFPVHVSLPDDGSCTLAPGLAADVDLRLPVEPALAVPVRALVDATGSGTAVLRVTGTRVERVPVKPVRLDGDRVAVTGPLSTGDEIVTAGLIGLVDGQPVQVLR